MVADTAAPMINRIAKLIATDVAALQRGEELRWD